MTERRNGSAENILGAAVVYHTAVAKKINFKRRKRFLPFRSMSSNRMSWSNQ